MTGRGKWNPPKTVAPTREPKRYKNRKPPEPAVEKLISPPGFCPNWRDENQLRHGCRDHPQPNVCRCPCGATTFRGEAA